MASSSQASTLVSRGKTSGETTAPKAPSSALASRARRASSRGAASSKGYFYADEGSAFKLSPSSVIGAAVSFIVFVFLLHIFGKIRG